MVTTVGFCYRDGMYLYNVGYAIIHAQKQVMIIWYTPRVLEGRLKMFSPWDGRYV
jgi:hypothetical protein